MDGKRNPNNWNFYFKSDGYLCFDMSDRNDIEELDCLKNSESQVVYIVTPVGERFACLKRN